MSWIDELEFNREGFIPVITQDADTGEVLMFAFANRESLERTVQTGRMTYFSRSRNKIWEKGETSGNVQEVKGIYTDCDKDVILAKVKQKGGAACHMGKRSCFFNELSKDAWKDVGIQVFDPKEVYGEKQ
jgi:phosphoribosyl-AMP cyclohydrolase